MPRWRSSAAARESHDELTLLDPKRHVDGRGGAAAHRSADDPEDVAASSQAHSAGPAARDTERVTTREQVPQPREGAEPPAPRRSSSSSQVNGRSCGRSADPSTRPATSESTAGRTSDGLNESDERATCVTTGDLGDRDGDAPRDAQPGAGADDRADGALERTRRREPRARPDRSARPHGCRPP